MQVAGSKASMLPPTPGMARVSPFRTLPGTPYLSRPVVIAILGLVAATAAVILAASLDSDGEPGMADRAATPAVQTPLPAAAETAPSFDVIRIGEQGNAVLAGRAAPRSEVTVLDGEHPLGQTTADERGEWVLVPGLAMEAGARALTIQARSGEETPAQSSAPVILVVPEGAGQPALAMAPQAEGGPRLILGPGGGETAPLSIDLVDMNQDGRLFMGGRAPAGAVLHLYLDNAFLGRAQADDQGGWRLAAKAAGGHALRADQVDIKGKVLARIEAPLQAPPAINLEGVVVEPGASLWTIARRLGGSGQAFTVIYQANRDRIRDPDRIYPGQVFLAPKN